MNLSIRPLKRYRDNMNTQGQTEIADKVQVAIVALQSRNHALSAGHKENAQKYQNIAENFLRIHNIPFGNRSLKGEGSSFITDYGQLGQHMRVCKNLKGTMPRKVSGYRRGIKIDRHVRAGV